MIDFYIGHGRAESGGSAVDMNLITILLCAILHRDIRDCIGTISRRNTYRSCCRLVSHAGPQLPHK